MATRAIPILVLLMAMLAGMARSDDSTKLPSSKASVVLPLLRKLSTTAHPTFGDVKKILGPALFAISSAGGLEFHYMLDDRTAVEVEAFDRPSQELVSIVAYAPGKKMKGYFYCLLSIQTEPLAAMPAPCHRSICC